MVRGLVDPLKTPGRGSCDDAGMCRADRFFGALSLVLAAGCGGAPQGVDAPPAPAAATVAEAPRVEPTWTQKAERWNHAVAFAPTGELLTAEGTALTVRAARDGSVVRSAPLCAPVGPDALRFAGPHTLVVACSDAWVVFSWPDLAKLRTVRTAIGNAAIGPDRLASLAGRRRVRIWKTSDLSIVDWFDVPGEVSSLAFSPDGGRLAISTDQALLLRDVGAQTNRVLSPGDSRAHSLAFSPDGHRLFAGTSGAASEIDVATAGVLRRAPLEGWVTAARYLSDGVIVATGARGLHLVQGQAAPLKIDDRLSEGLDVSPDASAFCAGDREGLVKCFSARGYGARSTPPPLAALPASAPPPETGEPLVDGPRAAKPPGGAPRDTTLTWSLYSEGWRRLALAPTGELLSSRGGMLVVHARDDGRVTGTASLCSSGINSLRFVGPQRLFFLCDHEAGIASYPAIKVIDTHPVDSVGQAISVGGGRVAFENGMGRSIRIVAIDPWKSVDEFPIQERLEHLALSRDGRKLALALYGRGVVLRDVATKKETVIDKEASGSGLAFSADGTRLFTLSRAFQAAEYDVATGAQKRAWSANTWITEAHYLDDDAIVAVGAGGLTIFAGGGGTPAPSLDPYRSAVAVSADGTTFCASGASGELACFRRTK